MRRLTSFFGFSVLIALVNVLAIVSSPGEGAIPLQLEEEKPQGKLQYLIGPHNVPKKTSINSQNILLTRISCLSRQYSINNVAFQPKN